jgi:beta-N-acetylhexosaminidase
MVGWTAPRAAPPDGGFIDARIDALTVDEQIGKLLFVAFSGTTAAPDVDSLVAEIHPGGVLFYGRNVGTLAQVRALTARIHAFREAPLVGIDQEGGFVARMPEGVPRIPSAMALGATRSKTLAFEAARDSGRCLQAAGFDVDFAPVLDVHPTSFPASIGTRAFSDDASEVAALGAAFIHGASAGGIAAVAKHFPGLGATADDPHEVTPTLRDGELAPFRAAVAAEVPAIMTSHAIMTRVDPKRPASLSPVWHELLRDELHFGGVVMSDALQMEGLPKANGIGVAAVDAILAGSDMVLVGWEPAQRLLIRNALRDAYVRGDISKDRLRKSLHRILMLEQRLRRAPAVQCTSSDVDRRIAASAVTLLKDDGPLLQNDDVLYVGVDGPLRRYFGKAVILPHTIEHPAYFERQLAAAGKPSTIVAAAYNESQLAIVHEARRLLPGARLLFVDLGSPYLLRDLTGAAAHLCVYGAGEPEQQAALDVLLGRARARGRLPISVAGLYRRGAGHDVPQLR